MARFNTKDNRRIRGQGAVSSEAAPSGRTAMGGPGYLRDAKSELFLLAVNDMYHDSFHETRDQRNGRLIELITEIGRAHV